MTAPRKLAADSERLIWTEVEDAYGGIRKCNESPCGPTRPVGATLRLSLIHI